MTDKRKQQEKNLRKIIKELNKDPKNFHCFFEPENMRTEWHHVLPKSQFPEHIDNPNNLLPVGFSAHHTLTFGTGRQIMNLPKIGQYLSKMKSLNEQYYHRYLLNHNIKIKI